MALVIWFVIALFVLMCLGAIAICNDAEKRAREQRVQDNTEAAIRAARYLRDEEGKK